MVYAIPSSSYAANMNFGTSTSLSSLSSASSYHSLPSPTPSPPRRTRHKPIFDLTGDAGDPQSSVKGANGATRTPLKALASHNAMLTMPVPPQLKPLPLSSSSDRSSQSPRAFPSKAENSPTDDTTQPAPLSNVPRRRTSIVGRSTFSGSVNRGAGLRLDLGDIANAGSPTSKDEEDDNADRLPEPPKTAPPNMLTTPRLYVRPTPAELAERQRQEQLAAQRQTSSPSMPSFIRKKSGELVKPSLKTVSMFSTPRTSNASSPARGLSLNMDVLPMASGTRSEPTTPLGPKMVHFDVKLEHVKHFLAEQKPLAVSRDGSPTETSEGGEDFFSYRRGGNGTNSDGGRSSEDEKVRKTLSIHVTNMPTFESALDALKARWESEHVRLENLSLGEDGRTVKGTVLVRNLAFDKKIAARFTMDRWQTTSEVTAKYVNGVLDGAYDRFEFAIRLADYLGGKIWEKTLEIAIRYSCDGHGDMWDSNGGQNYVVQFRRKTLPVPIRSNSEPNSEDEDLSADILRRRNEQVELKVAQLKKSLEKLVPEPVVPTYGRLNVQARFGSQPAQISPITTASGSPTASTFVNSRSAADVLQRVGKHGSPSTMNRAFFLSNEPNPPPLSPRRNREGTLAGRYDISSSLKNATLNSPTTRSPSSVPFPDYAPSLTRTPSRVYHGSPVPGLQGQTFVSNNVTFSMRSAGRGSPRDALTPNAGPGSSQCSPPFRTSSDSDLPASFQSASASPSSSGHFGSDMHAWGSHADGVARDAQRSYFALSPSTSWNNPLPTSTDKSIAAGSSSGRTGAGSAKGSEKGSSPPTFPPFEGGSGSISPRLSTSPPNSRFDSYPPLSSQFSTNDSMGSFTPAQDTTPTYHPGASGDVESADSALHSASSSTTSSPSMTTDSTAVSSPTSPPEALFNIMDSDPSADHNGSGSGMKDSTIDQFRFYTGTESLLTSRRSHSTSSVEDFLARNPTSADSQTPSTSSGSGHTTPQAIASPALSRRHSPAPPDTAVTPTAVAE